MANCLLQKYLKNDVVKAQVHFFFSFYPTVKELINHQSSQHVKKKKQTIKRAPVAVHWPAPCCPHCKCHKLHAVLLIRLVAKHRAFFLSL